MTRGKDSAGLAQGPQRRLAAPTPASPVPGGQGGQRDPAQIAALLQTVASELSQNDQRQGNSLAGLREKLDQMAVPAEAPAPAAIAASKPMLALEDRRLPAAPAPAPAAEPAQKQLAAPARSDSPSPAGLSIDQIYAAVASSYGDLAARRASAPAPVQAIRRPAAPAAEPDSDTEDGDFLDLSALAEPALQPLKAPPARATMPRHAPAPVVAPVAVAQSAPIVTRAPQPAQAIIVPPAPTPAPAPATALAMDKSIDDLARRLALTEAKVDKALQLSASAETGGPAIAQIDGLRAEIQKLTGEHEKISVEVGKVSADMRSLSESASRLAPMGDKLELLNEAILALRKDMPGFAGLAAQEAAQDAVQKAGDRFSGVLKDVGTSGELADKLATVQNLLLMQSREFQQADGRSIGALESIRGLVEKLHNRIDALEAESMDGPSYSDQPQHATQTPAATLAALSAAIPSLSPASQEPAPVLDAAAAPALSREDLIASARRAAEAASLRKQALEAEAKPAQSLNPRDLLAKPKPSGLLERLGVRGPIVTMAMVALLAMGLGVIYAKFLHHPAPSIAIEQATLPAMPDDLPDTPSKTNAPPVQAPGKGQAKPGPTAGAPASPANAAAPANATPGKTSMMTPGVDGVTAASADAMPPAAATKTAMATSASASLPQAAGAPDSLPAAIAPTSVRDAALAGDPAAAYTVAERFLTGKGVARDASKARHWYEIAAKAGSPAAEFQLGVLFEKGEDGIAADRTTAMSWYRKGADDGNPQAMHNLAVLFAGQNGGTPDYVSAAKWFEQAASYGLKDSQYNLAVLYQNGLGVQKNAGTAYKWFSIGAAHGDADAAKQRDVLRKDVPVATLASIDAQVKAWHPKQAQQISASAPVSADAQGAPVAATETAATPAMAPTAAQEVASVQKMLAKLGYDPGSLDGTLTAQTREAIRSFQQRSGLPDDGEISDALIGKLVKLGG